MKRQKKNIENIESALQTIYRANAMHDSVPGYEWERKVMQRIRSAGALSTESYFAALFSSAVWRLAPVAGALILVLGTWILQMDFTAEIEHAALMDPLGFDIVTKLGIL